jgi:hypothetical protein
MRSHDFTALGFLLLASALLSSEVRAQDQRPFDPGPTLQRLDGPVEGPGGTYIKVGLGHWQGDIFSSRSLTQWDGNLFGSEYNLTSAEIEVERHFDHTRLFLSGFAVGYRKDALRFADSGHMFHAAVFRSINLGVFAVRAGGGVEWGVPSLNFDTTEFDYRADGALRYSHIHPAKNVDIPVVGTSKDGAAYPFGEVSIVQRPGRFLIEGGMRLNIVPFQFDNYEVDMADRITHGFSERNVLMPYLFVNIGFKIF